MADCECYSHNGFLTSRGFRDVAQRMSLEGLEPLGDIGVGGTGRGSMSGLDRLEAHWVDDAKIDEQYRRFHNGS